MTGIHEDIAKIGWFLYYYGKYVEVATWQSIDVRDDPRGKTSELWGVKASFNIPTTREALQAECEPNLPWAEKQFLERISGKPLNPGETYKEWPWYKGNVEEHKPQGVFSHTYMERYWPKCANNSPMGWHWGIRYKYGDLNDVINLLAREPATRQAYLPVWFPEDTGAVHGQRVPCSIGYLFLMREHKLNIIYHIRSCDFFRHFRDDIYMTARLCQWVIERCQETQARNQLPADKFDWSAVIPGRLIMHIDSLHIFEADLPRLRRENSELRGENSEAD